MSGLHSQLGSRGVLYLLIVGGVHEDEDLGVLIVDSMVLNLIYAMLMLLGVNMKV